MVAGARYELQAWAWVEWPHRTRFAEDWLTQALLDTLVAFFPQMFLVSFDSWLLTCFFLNFNSFQLFWQIRAFQLPCIERCKVKAVVVPLQRENLRSGMRRRTAARHCTSLWGILHFSIKLPGKHDSGHASRSKFFRTWEAADCSGRLSDSLIVSYHDGTRSRSDPALRKSLQWAADVLGVSPDETSLSTVAGGITKCIMIYHTIYHYTLHWYLVSLYIRLAALHPSLKHDVKTFLMSLCLTHSHVSRSKLAMFHGFCRPF